MTDDIMDNHDDKGRFATGNKGGPGNPYSKKVNMLRAALLEAVTVKDIKIIAGKLIQKAKKGDLLAIKELLNRTIGKAEQQIYLNAETNTHHDGPKLIKMPLLVNRPGVIDVEAVEG